MHSLFFFYFIKFAQQNKERIFSTGLQNTWRGSSKYHLVDSSHPREHFNNFSTMIYPAKSNYTDHVSSEAVSGVPKADAKVKLCSKNRSSTCSRNKKWTWLLRYWFHCSFQEICFSHEEWNIQNQTPSNSHIFIVWMHDVIRQARVNLTGFPDCLQMVIWLFNLSANRFSRKKSF